nr:unnamed protein product [Callosobruchus chinensis]
MDNAEAGVCEEKIDNKSRFYFKGNPKTHVNTQLTNNSQTQSYQEKMGSPVNFEGNTSAPLAENASALEFIEDSDDSVKDANYVNECMSSSESSSSCSTCSSDSETRESRYDAENRKDTSKVRGRKRKLGPEKWKKNVAKKLRNMGEAYTNIKNNKAYSKRELQPPCDERCKLKCFNKISEEERTTIFKMYWALGSIQRQRDFISACMTTVKPKYRYTREGSTRRPNNAFYFDFKNQRIRICKKFFRNTLCINDRPIRTVLSKRDLNHPQFVQEDLRGKHRNHHKLDEEIKDSIRRHIDSVPRIPSHYCRANTTREFIEGGLTVADLHRTYTKLRQEVQQPAGNYVLYHKIFNEEYNISFFTPKKDQCELCVSYQNAGETDKATMKANFEKHLKQKELSRIEKQTDKESDNFVAVYDLQAVLPCPKGHTSSFFYVSKLNVFNFTVYDIKTNSVVCYVWNEAQGHRGANEIGTCVLNYLNVLNDRFANETDVIFYSDNCAGQQKNKFVLSMYAYAVRNLQNIKSITHKYLITGHTQNEGDNAHSLIERSVKRHLKSGPICIPEQYITLIRTAKKTGNPYDVQEFSHEDFYDLKHLANSTGFGNLPQSFKLSEVQILKIEKNNPYTLSYKQTFDQDEFESIEIDKARRSRGKGTGKSCLIKAYKNKIGITERSAGRQLKLRNTSSSIALPCAKEEARIWKLSRRREDK